MELQVDVNKAFAAAATEKSAERHREKQKTILKFEISNGCSPCPPCSWR
jgi:hypothetical protein